MKLIHFLQAGLIAAPAVAQSEADYTTVEHFPVPDGARLEIGGMDFMADGSLLVSTRRGQVWRLENPLVEDVADARWSLFAEGLWEGLGLNVVDGEIYVIQRGELSRLVDENGDWICDRVDTIADGWGLSGNYHEFAFGLPQDKDGNFVVTLNVAFFSPKWWHGKAPVPYRGWALKISPSGEITPFANGFRSPSGVAASAAGDLFVTDNQGDWCASSPIYHLVEGGFYGHPASLEWTEAYQATGTKASSEVPPPSASSRRPAAIWIPYQWSRSTGNLTSAPSDGSFGPWQDQLFVAELTNGMVLRAGVEEVHGQLQGWILPFRRDVGSVCRVAFASDGTLFCGLTNRGWGGKPPADGLARIRPTEREPLEIANVSLATNGFEVSFTDEIVGQVDPGQIRIVQYDYNYWWEYGSPEVNHREVSITSADISADRRSLFIATEDLVPAMVARIELPKLVSSKDEVLLHDTVAYTVNQIPGQPKTDEHVSKVVPPPPSKESGQQGWLMLTWGDALGQWEHEGWSLVNAEMDRNEPSRFALEEGQGALVNTGENPSHYVSRAEFGDCEVHLGFMLPKGGRAGVLLGGSHEIVLADSKGVKEPGTNDCGGIPSSNGNSGRAPDFNPFRGPGEWHELDLVYRAPRFNEKGEKIRDARFERVQVDGMAIHEGVRMTASTEGAVRDGESALGPLVLRGDAGKVAFRDVRVKPLGKVEHGDGWSEVFAEAEFDDWIAEGEAEWELDGDTIIGSGLMGHLFSPRADYENFELRAQVKISDGGNSGLYFRAQPTGGWPKGYEAQVNSSFPDPQKTGSLYNLARIETHLVPPDTWFDYHVLCENVEGGTRVVISVNGVKITDLVDEARHGPGHVALQQHHEGSVVSYRNVLIRER